jgi:hypothetical protein
MGPRKLYIAGPLEPFGYDHNSFLKAEVELRGAGYRVLDPAANPPGDSFEDRQRDRLAQIINVGGVAVLPGWETSAIATFEVRVADELNLPVLTVQRWLELAS